MRSSYCLPYCTLSLALVSAILPSSLLAQTAQSVMPAQTTPPAPAPQTVPVAVTPQTEPASGRSDAATLDTVVVSGSAKFKGLRKRDASFSISTATPEQIQEAAPTSTADLLKIVPGVSAEASSGSSGANVFVRGLPSAGDAPFFTLQLDGSPIYPVATLSFLENSTLFRIDDTIARMEGLRGGPSPIFSNGQPGVTVNFIQKQGQDIPEGIARVTLGSNQLPRLDLYSGGPLGEGSGWYYSAGGFWRDSQGARDPGFPSDKGGQISGTLTRRWDTGEFTLYGRKTKDENVFYTAVPLLSRGNGDKVSSFPGLNATRGSLVGPDFRRVTLPTGIGGGTMTRDLGDGRGVDLTVLGGSLDWDVGRWTISDRFNFVTGDAPTNGLFTGDNPQSLASFITNQYGADAIGTGRFVNGGDVVAQDQQVLSAGWWVIDKDLRSFTNDLRLSIELNSSNTLTFGTYYANYSSKDRWWLGNNMLLTAENHARRIDVDLADGRIPTRDGFTSTAFLNLRGDYDGTNLAFFVADEWNLNERWRIDLGARYERQEIDGTVAQTEEVDLDGDPNTLYDNATSVALDSTRRIDQDDSALSWTAGLNFKLNDNMSLFGRINSGLKFPSFDDLRDGVVNKQEIDQYEMGLKAGNEGYEVYLTAFYNDFVGLPFQAFDSEGNNIVIIGDSSSRGLELEGVVRPAGGFELAWNTTWIDGNYGDFGNFSGNQVPRQPRFRARLTPSYYWSTPWGDAKVYATYTHAGERYSDPGNDQRLSAYDTVDIGASLSMGDNWQFSFSGRNVMDEIALTEGNARFVGGDASSGGVFMGRPLEGRWYEFSAAYRW